MTTKFVETNSFRRLLKEHSLDEEGYWLILGESANCDYQGERWQFER